MQRASHDVGCESPQKPRLSHGGGALLGLQGPLFGLRHDLGSGLLGLGLSETGGHDEELRPLEMGRVSFP